MAVWVDRSVAVWSEEKRRSSRSGASRSFFWFHFFALEGGARSGHFALLVFRVAVFVLFACCFVRACMCHSSSFCVAVLAVCCRRVIDLR